MSIRTQLAALALLVALPLVAYQIHSELSARCDPAIEDFRAAIFGCANIITIDRSANLVCTAVQGKGAPGSGLDLSASGSV